MLSGFFYGTYHHTLDEKGRLSIPKEFRDLLKVNNRDKLIVSYYYDDRLRAFLQEDWDLMAADILGWDDRYEEVRKFKMAFMGMTALCSVDSHGRILIPEGVRKTIGLKKEIVIVGQGNVIDLWDKDKYLDFWERSTGDMNKSKFFPNVPQGSVGPVVPGRQQANQAPPFQDLQPQGNFSNPPNPNYFYQGQPYQYPGYQGMPYQGPAYPPFQYQAPVPQGQPYQGQQARQWTSPQPPAPPASNAEIKDPRKNEG